MSSAPHLHRVLSLEQDAVLAQAPEWEVGVRTWAAGSFPLDLACDWLAYVLQGRARLGEVALQAGALAHLKSGWSGRVEVEEPLRFSYASCPGTPGGAARVLPAVMKATPEKDWGPIPTMLEGLSRTSGTLLSRDPDGGAESGMWICTPGVWECHVTRDEYCHFLAGRCVYTHESGEEIPVEPDTLAVFPRHWKGRCAVSETVRKVYLIR